MERLMKNGIKNHVVKAIPLDKILPLPFETLKEQLRERANPVPAVPEFIEGRRHHPTTHTPTPDHKKKGRSPFFYNVDNLICLLISST